MDKLYELLYQAKQEMIERLNEMDADELQTMIDNDEPHDMIFEIADNNVPIYTADILEMALCDLYLATEEPELGAAFDGSPTPCNIIASNIFSRIEQHLWERWGDIKDNLTAEE